jgi:hypothetical protein
MHWSHISRTYEELVHVENLRSSNLEATSRKNHVEWIFCSNTFVWSGNVLFQNLPLLPVIHRTLRDICTSEHSILITHLTSVHGSTRQWQRSRTAQSFLTCTGAKRARKNPSKGERGPGRCRRTHDGAVRQSNWNIWSQLRWPSWQRRQRSIS